jgi:hemoglobin/transferrin/lactoferrin receptor protein
VPNVDDLSKVFETAGNNIIVPNPNLKPEKSLNFDLNFDIRLFENRVYWENRVYATRLFDALVVAPFQFEGQDSIVYNKVKSRVLASQNQQNAQILGFISEIKATLSHELTLKGAISYTHGRFINNGNKTPMDHIPPLGGRFALQYQMKHFNTEFYTVFNAWKRLSNYYLNAEDNEAYATPDGMPAWITLNWKASYELNKTFTLQGGVENIADTQYRTFASGINAAGRNVFGVVRVQF